MRPDARMRLDSVSKWWATAVVLQLAQEGKLRLMMTRSSAGARACCPTATDHDRATDDRQQWPHRRQRRLPVAERLPGPRQGRQATSAADRGWPRDCGPNPAAEASPLWLIRLAAWQPLLSAPGSRYHHSNIGWNIVGLIAARVAGKPLPTLYRERIFQPLGLKQTSYDPQGPIAAPHAQGYGIAADGTLTDTTARAPFKGADGAIISNATDTAAFLAGLMGGKLVDRARLVALWGGGTESGCARGLRRQRRWGCLQDQRPGQRRRQQRRRSPAQRPDRQRRRRRDRRRSGAWTLLRRLIAIALPGLTGRPTVRRRSPSATIGTSSPTGRQVGTRATQAMRYHPAWQ